MALEAGHYSAHSHHPRENHEDSEGWLRDFGRRGPRRLRGLPVERYDGAYGRSYGYDSDAILVDPPAPRYEYVGPPPVVGYFWIDGYWGRAGRRYVWVPGCWERRDDRR